MKTLIIDKSKWYRGNGSKYSALLRKDDNKMCCLGFYCLNEGYTKEQIEETTYPSWIQYTNTNQSLTELRSLFDEYNYKLHGYELHVDGTVQNHQYCKLEKVIGSINDCAAIDDEKRIELLRPLFREYLDTELEFVEGNE